MKWGSVFVDAKLAAAAILVACAACGAGGSDTPSAGEDAGVATEQLADGTPLLQVRQDVVGAALSSPRGPSLSPRTLLDADELEAAGVLTPQRVARGPAGPRGTAWVFGQRSPPHLVLLMAEAGAEPRVAGREGDGPGEFRELGWVGVVGDRFWTWDGRRRMLSLFDSDLQFERELRLADRDLADLGVTGSFFPGAVLGDGVVVGAPLRARPAAGEGLNSVPGSLVRVGPEGSVHTLHGSEGIILEEWGGIGSAGGGLLLDRSPPFGWHFETASAGQVVYALLPDGTLGGWDATGTRVRVVDPGIPLREPTANDLARAMAPRLDNPEVVNRGVLEGHLRGIAREGLIMPIDRMVGGGPHLWIFPNHHLLGSHGQARPAIVLDPERPAFAVVWVPSEFEPWGSSEDGVWGFLRDATGRVELVLVESAGLVWVQ